MNLKYRLGAAFTFTALVLCSRVAFAITGPVSSPPGGFNIASTCSDTTTPCAFGSSTTGATLTYQGFNFSNYRDLYWMPQTAESPTAVTYSPSASNLAGGIAVWQSTSPFSVALVNTNCGATSYDIRVVMTVTDTNGIALALTDPATVGITTGITGPLLNVTGSFKVNIVFQARLSGSQNAWGMVSSTDGDHCTVVTPYWSDGVNAGNFYYDLPTPPSMANSFTPSTIQLNQTSTHAYTIGNSNPLTTLTGLAFSDTLPSGVTVAGNPNLTNSCGGTASASGSVVSLSAGQVGPNATCTVSVAVVGTTVGAKLDTVGATSTNGGAGNTANASLEILGAPSIAKVFAPTSIAVGATSTIRFTIGSPNDTTIDANFSDSLPAGMTVAAVPNLTNTCGGTYGTTGNTVVNFSNASLAPGQCTLTVDVTSTADKVYTNSVTINSAAAGNGNTSAAALRVANPPAIVKAFGAATIPYGGTTSLTFTISNANNVNTTLTGIAFTDNLPAGLVVATAPGLTNSGCGGTATATAGSSVVSLSGGSLAPAAQCSVVVNVTANSFGVKNNSVAATSVEGGTGNTSNASVTVACNYTLSSSGTSAPAAGMSGTFNVTTVSTCPWTATSNAAWLTTSSTGTGNGMVSFTVAATTSVPGRSGSITVGDQTYSVTQTGVQPASLVATASSPTSVSLTWTSDPVDHFEVWRNVGAGYVLVGSPTTTSYTDSTATANNEYAYKVRAVDAGANASAYTNVDVATTFTFTDDPLVAGTTDVKAVHIAEVRQAVNALRAIASLTPATFTDPTLSNTVAIKAVHITELRTALDAARSALALSALSYSTITPGTTVIAATDVQQLRDSLK